MSLYELIHDSFDINSYEQLLIELFNINLYDVSDITYLIDDKYKAHLKKITDYTSFFDDNFEEIKLLLVKADDIRNLNIIENLIYDLLTMNQNDSAIVAIYDGYNRSWYLTYLFNSFVIENNRLISKKSKITDYLHEFGSKNHDELLDNLLDTSNITSDVLKELFMLKDNESELISDLIRIYQDLNEEDNYSIIMKLLESYLLNDIDKLPKATKKLFSKYEVDINSQEENIISLKSIHDFYCVIHSQTKVKLSQVRELCQNTLIEYLYTNSKFSKDDIKSYVIEGYFHRKDIIRYIDESKNHGGKSFVQLKIPLNIVYNIDVIDKLLDKVKILDISINSAIVIVTMLDILSELVYINRLLQGYVDVNINEIKHELLSDNLYATTCNKDSLTTLFTTLKVNMQIDYIPNNNFKLADALNLYKNYDNIEKELANIKNWKRSKHEVLNEVIRNYNKNHMLTKLNINIERQYEEKNNMPLFIWQLDFPKVFLNHKKFDIIISHLEEFDNIYVKRYRKALKEFKIYNNEYPFEYYFIEKSLKIAKGNAILSFIMDNYYQKTESDNIRRLLMDTTIIEMRTNNLMLKNHKAKKEHKINNTTLQNNLGLKPWNIGE